MCYLGLELLYKLSYHLEKAQRVRYSKGKGATCVKLRKKRQNVCNTFPLLEVYDSVCCVVCDIICYALLIELIVYTEINIS